MVQEPVCGVETIPHTVEVYRCGCRMYDLDNPVLVMRPLRRDRDHGVWGQERIQYLAEIRWSTYRRVGPEGACSIWRVSSHMEGGHTAEWGSDGSKTILLQHAGRIAYSILLRPLMWSGTYNRVGSKGAKTTLLCLSRLATPESCCFLSNGGSTYRRVGSEGARHANEARPLCANLRRQILRLPQTARVWGDVRGLAA